MLKEWQELCEKIIAQSSSVKQLTAKHETIHAVYIGQLCKIVWSGKELVPLKHLVKLRWEFSANDTSRHPKVLKIGPNHGCQ